MSKIQKNEVDGVEETLDRMSRLPDSLLIQILSLLPTKDAVSTCLVSKSLSCYDDDIVNLLSVCPALETLELSRYRGLRCLDITSSNVKRLTLAEHWGPDVESGLSLKIIAPHVQHLEISGEMGCQRCKLLNVSSLVTANINCDINHFTFAYDVEEYGRRDGDQVFRNSVLDCIQKLSYATELIFGNWLTEAIFTLQLDGVPLPELRCKCLTLKLHTTNYTVYGIASILQASPLLETLNIHLVDDIHVLLENDSAKTNNSNLRSWISNIVFPNVKNVKIVGCTRECSKTWSKHKLFKLSKVLLKNAVVLKEFVIVAERRECRECSEYCVSQYLSGLAQKLLSIHRSSKKFVITYKEFDDMHDYTGSDYDRILDEMAY